MGVESLRRSLDLRRGVSVLPRLLNHEREVVGGVPMGTREQPLRVTADQVRALVAKTPPQWRWVTGRLDDPQTRYGVGPSSRTAVWYCVTPE